MDLADIRSRWNEVLDLLERENRIAWLAFFDARLVSLNNNELRLSFIDAEKLSGAHDYAQARKDSHRHALESAIKQVYGVSIAIITE
ncbi:MAG: hypothetical protein FJW91_04805 [Actinobacteria bacterium]|nr:hypothetical protein [Actinomycetota bacterium]